MIGERKDGVSADSSLGNASLLTVKGPFLAGLSMMHSPAPHTRVL